MANTGRNRNTANTESRVMVGVEPQKTMTENTVLEKLGIIGGNAKNLMGKLSDIAKGFADVTSDYLLNGGLKSMIHDPNAYEGIQFVAQLLGYEPISLLGKDYAYIFDHVRRNYTQDLETREGTYDWPKFTFYGNKPSVRFADVDNDPIMWLGNWSPLIETSYTEIGNDGGDRVTEYSYAESKDNSGQNNYVNMQDKPGLGYHSMNQMDANTLRSTDLLKKTNDLFNAGRMDTLVARFHGRAAHDNNQIESARSQHGVSHGRNLLKLSPTQHGTYDNPYCRVWTYHNQYSKVTDMIRPFLENEQPIDYMSLYNGHGWNSFRNHITNSLTNGLVKETDEIPKRFADNTVLNWSNGFVNIAPSAKISDYSNRTQDDSKIRIKKCMFSIENLAWRKSDFDPTSYDANGLSPEQKGPFGGRIMWFPPYGITFQEDVQVVWNENDFIGRGEKIFTYTNTRRNGNLSFMMLIDHPAVLDYWNRKDNDGNDLIKGNDGGVNEKNNEEQTLLRFFAGCDILNAQPQKIEIKTPPVEEEAPPTVITSDEEIVADEPKGEKTIIAVLYYPNNYSGMDDEPEMAVNYLMNGIGAQKGYRVRAEAGKEREEEIPINLSAWPYVNGQQYGGYEMGDKGISVLTTKLSQEEAIASMKPKVHEVEMFKDANTAVSYGDDSISYERYVLTKQIGAKAQNSYNDAQPDSKGREAIDWYDYRWYTRVDKNTMSQALTKDDSYFDGKSYHYNSSGYQDGAEKLNLSIDAEKGEKLISFTSLFIALHGNKYSDEAALKKTFANKFEDADVELAKELLDSGTTITQVTTAGAASSHSTSSQSNKNQCPLGKERAQTILAWLRAMDLKLPKAKEEPCHVGPVAPMDVDHPMAKAWRSAYVKITYKNESLATQKEQNARSEVDVVTHKKNPYLDSMGTIQDVIKTTKADTKLQELAHNSGIELENPMRDDAEADFLSIKGGLASEKAQAWNEYVKRSTPNGGTDDENVSVWGYRELTNPAEIQDMPQMATLQQKAMTIDMKEVAAKMQLNLGNELEANMRAELVNKYQPARRYDNEGEFFEKLTKKSPLARHLISEKIKYFDPAFHSISPEGFNARLTFLHQCTRQGPTYANSDTMGKNANNLAFGRPPICILRLGDFYYTKIVINHIGITYDPLTWDLNQEGIGVMPMMAKVSMNFTFIGGSDMTGPISRLQNAVSFNYYANTSVYDNRAERVTYDDKGNVTKFEPFEYGRESYQSVKDDSNVSLKKEEKEKK